MRDTRVEEVEHISSDSDSDENPGGPHGGMPGEAGRHASQELTVGIFPNHVQQGTYFLHFLPRHIDLLFNVRRILRSVTVTLM